MVRQPIAMALGFGLHATTAVAAPCTGAALDGDWVDSQGIERWVFHRGGLVVIEQLRSGVQPRVVAQGWEGYAFRFTYLPAPKRRSVVTIVSCEPDALEIAFEVQGKTGTDRMTRARAAASAPTPALDAQPTTPSPNPVPPTERPATSSRPADWLPADAHPGRDWMSPTLGRMRWIEPRTFPMGSPAWDPHREEDEAEHDVTLSVGFWLMEHEVTQAQWLAVMGNEPSAHPGCATCPVEQVSWNDVQAYIARAAERDHAPYRLPTEAEWESAARGTSGPAYVGPPLALEVRGWLRRDSDGATHPVCTRRAPYDPAQGYRDYAVNYYLVCDLTGNVAEWVHDGYGPYPAVPRAPDANGVWPSVVDPQGPNESTERVVRGGSFRDDTADARFWARDHAPPDLRDDTLGFRLAVSGALVAP